MVWIGVTPEEYSCIETDEQNQVLRSEGIAVYKRNSDFCGTCDVGRLEVTRRIALI